MTAAELLGRPATGACVVRSASRHAYRAFLPPAVPAAGFGWLSVSLDVPLLWVAAAGLLLTGLARSALWYRCGDDSLRDDGQHLTWSRGGVVVAAVAWSQLGRRHAGDVGPAAGADLG